MRTNYLKNNWMHFTMALGLMSTLATPARAESFLVKVPFAFEVAGKSLPAGAYTVDSVATGILTIHNATSADSAAIVVSPAGYTITPKSSLIFDCGSEMPVLSTVNLNSGLTLTVAPAKRLSATLVLPTRASVALSRP